MFEWFLKHFIWAEATDVFDVEEDEESTKEEHIY
jgi:hypothetical protein